MRKLATLALIVILAVALVPLDAAVAAPPPKTVQTGPKLPPSVQTARDRYLFSMWVAHARRVYLYKLMAAHAAAEKARAAERAKGHGGVQVQGVEVCNGVDLPTCAIVRRESGFNPRAENPTSTASGLYQFIDGTFGYCRTGYRHASYAPVTVQVSCARRVWDHGRGAGHWRL